MNELDYNNNDGIELHRIGKLYYQLIDTKKQ